MRSDFSFFKSVKRPERLERLEPFERLEPTFAALRRASLLN